MAGRVKRIVGDAKGALGKQRMQDFQRSNSGGGYRNGYTPSVGETARRGLPAGRGQTMQDISAPVRRPTPLNDAAERTSRTRDQVRQAQERSRVSKLSTGSTAAQTAGRVGNASERSSDKLRQTLKLDLAEEKKLQRYRDEDKQRQARKEEIFRERSSGNRVGDAAARAGGASRQASDNVRKTLSNAFAQIKRKQKW